ncbi:hypothetical protein [Pseudoalteromonas piscicida]|uniref:hypothetical protein n=1 Tax=Pseudoalteromonas piscicida TaxID=43662 RepID=UPI0030AAA869
MSEHTTYRFILEHSQNVLVNDETKKHKLALMSWLLITCLSAYFSNKDIVSLLFVKFSEKEPLNISEVLLIPLAICGYQFIMYMYTLNASIKSYMGTWFSTLLKDKKNSEHDSIDFYFQDQFIPRDSFNKSIQGSEALASNLKVFLDEVKSQIYEHSPLMDYKPLDIPTFQKKTIESHLELLESLDDSILRLANSNGPDNISYHANNVKRHLGHVKRNYENNVPEELKISIESLEVLEKFNFYIENLEEFCEAAKRVNIAIDCEVSSNKKRMNALVNTLSRIFKDEKLICDPNENNLLFFKLSKLTIIFYVFIPVCFTLFTASYTLFKYFKAA